MEGEKVTFRVSRSKRTGISNNIVHQTLYQQTKQKNENHQYNSTLTCIKIAHLNIIGLRNKIDLLSTELSSYDIICVSETKLSDNVETKNIEIDGFHHPIRRDRRFNNGGGLLVYIKSNICFHHRQDIENQYIENIWIQINSLKKNFLLGVFYRPPNSTVDYWDSFESCLESATDLNSDVIIMGDFNHDMNITSNASKLKKIISKFNIENMINEPTRITDTTQTCIDLILTNHTSIINTTEVLPPFCSDHCTITAEITFKTYTEQAYRAKFWKYEQADQQGIQNKLNSTDWSFIQNNDNIDEINNKFHSILLDTAETCIPCIDYTKRPSDKPWMNGNIRKQIRQRNRLYNKAKQTQSPIHLNNYRNKRNDVVSLIREAKKSYMQKLQANLADPKTPIKQWYKIANEISSLKNKKNPPPPLKNNTSFDIHPLDKANTLNKHFANISKIENPPPLPEETHPNFSLDDIYITEQDVSDQIHALNVSKPSGPDEVSPKLLKTFGKALIRPITLLFNKSMTLGQVPSLWKMSNISAIFKGKGDKQIPSNYRPISITSCLGKMLEKIIFKYLYNYLDAFQILTKFQSGFRPKDSTVNQLLEIYHTIIENLDKGKEIKFIFCDISKAFDKVWHDGLLFKLKKYGISGKLFSWFKSYLSNRKQRVINEGQKSTWENTLAGVPQGSVLGPYLFLLYVNDIVEKVKCNIRLFADDTSLFTVIENADSIKLIDTDLYNIAKWADEWCIMLNPSKTKSMKFSRKRSSQWPNVKFNDIEIPDEPYHTHLGLTLSSDASWSEHINRIYEKASYRLNILRMLKYDMDRKSLIRFYTSYIRPILEYGSIIWDNCTKQESDLLESIQLDAARIITGLRRGTSHAILYEELGWIPLSKRRENTKLIHFFKILNKETPFYINEIIDKYNNHEIGYALRNENLRYPTPRTASFKNSFFPSTIDQWNNLDQHLANCTSLFSLKREIQKNIPKPPKQYSHGERQANIILCQLRNSKSQLIQHLFNDHLNDNPNCTTCNVPETSEHFLFHCPKFSTERINMINTLLSKQDLYSKITISSNDMLKGNADLSYEENCILFDYVILFIKQTNRL